MVSCPTDATEAVRLLLRAAPAPVQVASINDRVFLVNASLGLYPDLLEDRKAYTARFGRSRWVAFVAACATLLRPIGTLSMIGLMLHGSMGRLGEAAGVEGFEFQHMVVRPTLAPGRTEVVVAFDGEVARMRSPIDIRVLDKPLYLLQATGTAGLANAPVAAA